MKLLAISLIAILESAAQAEPVEPRSPGTAVFLSAGATVAGIAMLAAERTTSDYDVQRALAIGGLAAIAIGPTLGHAYAGRAWNTGLKVRLISLGVAIGSLAIGLAACPPFSGACNSDGAVAIAGVGFVGGGLTYAGATLYEIVDAGNAARRSNERRQLQIVPATGTGPGVTLVGTF